MKKHNCNPVHKYVDITKLDEIKISEADMLLGWDNCGDIKNVISPKYLDDEGEGVKALFDDGKYKEVLTKEEIEDLNVANKEEVEEAIEQIIEDLNETEIKLDGHIANQKEINKKVRSDINTNSSNIETLTTNLSEVNKHLSERIDTNVLEINKNKNNIDANKTSITELSTKVDTNIKDINTKLSTEVERLDLKDDRLSDRIDKEVKERIEADAIHTADIKSLDTSVKSLDDRMKSNVESLNSNISTVNSKLTDKINDEINNRETVIKRVDTDIDRVEDDIKAIKEGYTTNDYVDGKFATKDDLKVSNSNIATNKANIETNKNEIETLKSASLNRTHFRGYFSTNAEVKAIENSEKGDYAYSAESGTKWVFREDWVDSGVKVPDKVTPASKLIPLGPGEASNGKEDAYARGDHRHPSDPNKVNVGDVYTKEEVDDKITDSLTTIDLTPYAKKTELNSLKTSLTTEIDKKANTADVNRRLSEVYTEINKKASFDFVEGLNKDLNSKLATKLEAKDIVNKADKVYVDGEINKVNTELDTKATKVYVDAEKKKLEDRIVELENIIKEIAYWK